MQTKARYNLGYNLFSVGKELTEAQICQINMLILIFWMSIFLIKAFTRQICWILFGIGDLLFSEAI